MKEYNASVEHDPEEWLALEEVNRIALVEAYVKNNEKDIDEDVISIHSTIHIIVENQLAEMIKSPIEAYNRLLRQGLSRHDTIHAIGSVVIEDIYDIIKNKTSFNPVLNISRMRKLTAKKWRKNK